MKYYSPPSNPRKFPHHNLTSYLRQSAQIGIYPAICLPQSELKYFWMIEPLRVMSRKVLIVFRIYISKITEFYNLVK